MEAPKKAAKNLSQKTKVIIALAALLALSLVFALAYEYYAPRRAAEKLYSEAQRAIQKGDLKTAETKLKELLKKAPEYPGAKDELARVESEIRRSSEISAGGSAGNPLAGRALGGSSAQGSSKNGAGGNAPGELSDSGGTGVGGGGSSGNGGGNGGSASGGSIQNPSLTAVLPRSISGFTQIDRTTSPLEEIRAYKPDRDGIVKLMTVVARNSGNGEDAQKYIDKEIKAHYSENGKSVLVKQKNAYFGTDSSGFAVLAWRVAGTVVVIEMQASGVQPKGLYDQLMSVADQFP